MWTIAISQHSDIMRKILNYLKLRNYKNISANYTSEEITAEHKRSFFKRDNKFRFNIIYVNETVTNIEIKVNPHNDHPTPYDLNKEIILAEKIYSYL